LEESFQEISLFSKTVLESDTGKQAENC